MKPNNKVESSILDFDDYAKPIDFKFNGSIFRVPAFHKSKLEKLMKINQEFIDFDDGQENDATTDDENTSKIEIDKTLAYLDMQDNFITLALLRKQSDDTYTDIAKDELIDWPVRVKNKVMQTISEQMAATSDDVEKTLKDVPAKKS